MDAGTTLTYGSNGAVFTIQEETNAPTIKTNKYIFFGRLDVELMAAPGDGIVTSAVLQSDDLDEIDWEWTGNDNTQAQSNYFSKGDTSTYNRGGFHSVDAPLTSFHTYSVEWTPAAVEWIIDGNVVRTLTYDDATGGTTFPQTPMQVKLGTWVGGCSTCAPGTVEWAGGHTNMADAPFLAYYKSIAITDYAGGSAPPANAVKEYIYGDHSGTYQSIKVVDGEGSSSSASSSSSVSSSAKATTHSKTSTPSSSSTMTKAETTTKAESTTKVETTTKASTTMTTASSVARNTTTPASSTGQINPSSTTGGAPSTQSTGAAARDIATFGSVLLAGAGVVMAQML